MKLHILLIVFAFLVLTFSAFSAVEGMGVTPFIFELPTRADLYYTPESIENGGPPETILQRSSEVTLPLIVKSSSEDNIHLRFHTTYGEQMAIPKLPPGIDAHVEPNDIRIKHGENTTINLIVKTADNAPDGWYFMNIVGVMDSGDFSGTNISLKVGNGSEMPIHPSQQVSYLDVKQGSFELLYSGNIITEIIDYYITVEPKTKGSVSIDIFKNNQFFRTDILSDEHIVKLTSGNEYYYYKLTVTGKKDQDVYRVEFKYDDQNVEKIIPIAGTSMGIINTKIDSPLQQFKSGVPVQNVQCNEGLQLMMKSNNGNPVCIKPSTASKLLQMGIVDRIPVGSMQKPQPITAVHKPQYGSCPVSFIEYGLSKSYPNAMKESKAPINAMGTLFSSFDEAKNDAGIQDIFLPTYMPDCLKLHSIRVNKAVPTASTTTIVYLLDGMEPKGYFTENNVTENGLLILIQKERGIVYSLPINYVQDQARENKDLGWNYTIISNSAVLLKNRDVNMPTEADMVFMHQGVRVSSKILEIAEIEKITRSMFE